MADYELPADLIATQRAFLEASARAKEIGDHYPPATAIAAGEAAVPEELRQALHEARAEEQRLAVALQNDPRFRDLGNAFEVRMAARRAARSTPAE